MTRPIANESSPDEAALRDPVHAAPPAHSLHHARVPPAVTHLQIPGVSRGGGHCEVTGALIAIGQLFARSHYLSLIIKTAPTCICFSVSMSTATMTCCPTCNQSQLSILIT